MELKKLLGKASALAREHSDKLPKQVRPAIEKMPGSRGSSQKPKGTDRRVGRSRKQHDS